MTSNKDRNIQITCAQIGILKFWLYLKNIREGDPKKKKTKKTTFKNLMGLQYHLTTILNKWIEILSHNLRHFKHIIWNFKIPPQAILSLNWHPL